MTNIKEPNHNPQVEESLKKQAEIERYALENTSFTYLSGSKLYGTNTHSSDTDIRGVFIHSVEKALSILKEDNITEVVFTGDDDKVLFELKNFGTLLREQNPNVIESLWIPNDKIIQDSILFQELRDNKHELISSLALDKMLGFATAQYKMAKKFEKKHFTKEMDQPLRKNFLKLVSNPQNKDFGKNNFPIENTCAFKHPEHPNIYTLYSSEYLDNKEHSWLLDNNFSFVKNNSLQDKPILAIVEFRAEEFKQAKLTYNNFLAWKENGNMSKLDLAAEVGYQPKPMMHALRNLYMAKEFIDTGSIVLFRKENDFLKSVREGKFSLSECEDYYSTLNEYVAAKKTTFSLPPFNDKLLNEIIKDNYLKHFNLQPSLTNSLAKPKM